MFTPMLEREQAWITRIKEIKEILRDPQLCHSEIQRLHRELKALVKNTSKSFYEGSEAMYPWEYTDLPTGHLEPSAVAPRGSVTLEEALGNA
jgi:hypothetical protein